MDSQDDDETDRLDEAIVPTDMNVITDDDLRAILANLSDGVKFTMISGTTHGRGRLRCDGDNFGSVLSGWASIYHIKGLVENSMMLYATRFGIHFALICCICFILVQWLQETPRSQSFFCDAGLHLEAYSSVDMLYRNNRIPGIATMLPKEIPLSAVHSRPD